MKVIFLIYFFNIAWAMGSFDYFRHSQDDCPHQANYICLQHEPILSSDKLEILMTKQLSSYTDHLDLGWQKNVDNTTLLTLTRSICGRAMRYLNLTGTSIDHGGLKILQDSVVFANFSAIPLAYDENTNRPIVTVYIEISDTKLYTYYCKEKLAYPLALKECYITFGFPCSNKHRPWQKIGHRQIILLHKGQELEARPKRHVTFAAQPQVRLYKKSSKK